MTKTLNQIIFFFLHQNQNIFFSNIGNQNIVLKKLNGPSPIKLGVTYDSLVVLSGFPLLVQLTTTTNLIKLGVCVVSYFL